MEHIYYEVGTSLLAKPQALCDLVEFEAGRSCVVFCNSPSDADFADVILKKRGLASLKLIGYVPQIKLTKAIQQLQKKEITALVLTDVAARGVPLEEFDLVINYSVPTDPEVYFNRFVAEGETKTKKVLSLVSAMDLTNFHFLKKLGKVEFVQAEPPTAEALFASKFTQLRDQAIERAAVGDLSLNELVEKVLADDKAREIVALLLNNTLTVIPSLRAATAPAREERSDFDEDEVEDEVGQPDFDRRDGAGRRGGRDRREGRGGRDRGGDRGGDRGADRGGRGERSSDRGGRGRYRDESFGEDDDRQPAFFSEEEGDGERGSRRGGRRGERRERDQEGRDGGRRGRGREPRKPMMVDKEARLYVGAGAKQGLSQDAFKEQVASACGVSSDEIHRVSVRGSYSFVDVSEKIADQVVDKLGDAEVPGKGEKYFVKKAVTLAIPREPTADELAAMQAEDNYSGSDESDSRYDDDGGDNVRQLDRSDRADERHDDNQDEAGPTLLAVDDQA